MTKYRVKAYPNWEKWEEEIEANSPEEAVEIMNQVANDNCCFIATLDDVEEILEE